ncbi:uncharacterized protein LOC119321471 [Triticum dicoccoides]|uniref:uncharacterized protein LOC119321471 n=1 Tax=Triticum dicoccoides TaxID=85692 RepID=UPI001890B8C9|nr:uncharacterized protein LOC119321471 [Triticum dicoccoides]
MDEKGKKKARALPRLPISAGDQPRRRSIRCCAGRRPTPASVCPLSRPTPLSSEIGLGAAAVYQLPHLHPVSSPTSATPPRARGAESRKHDAGCGGVRRARPIVFSLQGRIRPNLHATSSTPYIFPFSSRPQPLDKANLMRKASIAISSMGCHQRVKILNVWHLPFLCWMRGT